MDYLGSLIDSYLISFDLDAAPLIRQLFGIPEGAAAPVTTGFEKVGANGEQGAEALVCSRVWVAGPDGDLVSGWSRNIDGLKIFREEIQVLVSVAVFEEVLP